MAGIGSLSLPLAWPQERSTDPRLSVPLNRFPRMVQEYFVERLRSIEAESLKAKAALATKADAEAYVQAVRRKIRKCFGPDPERTPLNARVAGTVERDAYRIEKVIFESRPGFLVTANLYVPKGRQFPLPGVVGTCGHSANGKAGGTYQAFSQGLARLGYVVLIFDPIGQGERMQYVDASLKPRLGEGTREHLHAGNQQFLVGESFAMWRAWDGIRALDYLLSRKEVDPKQVGVTGNSGGGTMTTWLCGLDPRWTMAAPSCFVTTFRRNMENELSADTEQCPPKALALGLDHDDFIAAMAPRPVILLGKERDYFDARGHEEAYLRLKRLYRLLGAEESIARFRGPGPHGFSQDNREAMYGWFNRVTGISDAKTEPELTMEKDETLYCTPRGQVAELNSRTVYSFTKKKSEDVARKRQPLRGSALTEAMTRVLRLPDRGGASDFRILRPRTRRQYPQPHAATYAVETEPGIHAIVYRLSGEPLLSQPPRGQDRAVLYVSHHSSDAELRDEPLIGELLAAEPSAAFFTCDVRGIGDSRPGTGNENSFLNPYGTEYFYAVHSIMLDYPYAAQRTFDILRVLDWLRAYGHTQVHLAAKGWGAIPATFASLLSDQVAQVTLKNALSSFSEVAESESYSWPLSAFIPGLLELFDLPDCYKALESKRLRMADPLQAI
ncbi:MAG: prolyl oligopeptidase family serine peptidase [Bryobacteraceae bacterium]